MHDIPNEHSLAVRFVSLVPRLIPSHFNVSCNQSLLLCSVWPLPKAVTNATTRGPRTHGHQVFQLKHNTMFSNQNCKGFWKWGSWQGQSKLRGTRGHQNPWSKASLNSLRVHTQEPPSCCPGISPKLTSHPVWQVVYLFQWPISARFIAKLQTPKEVSKRR